MRLIHSYHLSYPALRAARVAIAAGAVAGVVAIAACTDTGGKTITAPPQAPRTATSSSGGLAFGGKIKLCVSSTSPAGSYTFVNSQVNRTHAQDGFGMALPGNGFENPPASGNWYDPGDGGAGTATTNALEGVTYQVAAGSCVFAINRTAGDPGFPSQAVPNDSYSAATFQYTGVNTAVGGAVYDHTDCTLDQGVLIPQQQNPPGSFPTWGNSGLTFNGVSTTYLCDNHNNPTRAFANLVHGDSITFVFVAAPQTIPLFVIGDIEPHGIGDVVNFWGPQWWKNNPMTLFSTKGWESFKGFASAVNRAPVQGYPCGTWTSRVGNSPPPPDVIPEFVGIIVTDNVYKIGPGEGGGIKQIVIVHSDGNYGPAPGHRGGGPVVSIECPAT